MTVGRLAVSQVCCTLPPSATLGSCLPSLCLRTSLRWAPSVPLVPYPRCRPWRFPGQGRRAEAGVWVRSTSLGWFLLPLLLRLTVLWLRVLHGRVLQVARLWLVRLWLLAWLRPLWWGEQRLATQCHPIRNVPSVTADYGGAPERARPPGAACPKREPRAAAATSIAYSAGTYCPFLLSVITT